LHFWRRIEIEDDREGEGGEAEMESREIEERTDEGRSRRAKGTKSFKNEGDKAGVGVSGKRSKLGGFERFVTRQLREKKLDGMER